MWIWRVLDIRFFLVGLYILNFCFNESLALAAGRDSNVGERMWMMTGVVQYEDFRRVSQATVELRDQVGLLLDTPVTNEGGVFIFKAPDRGIYSLRAI